MGNKSKVSVFEGDDMHQIQIVKAKLEESGIAVVVDNSYMGFLTTPTATNLKLKVKLKDEHKAFEIIDQYLKENPQD